MVPAGHGRIQRDQPQAVEIPHARDRFLRGSSVEQTRPQRGALVVVARDPHDRCAQSRGERLGLGAQGGVCLGLAEVGEVAREHDHVGTDARALDRREGHREIRGRVVASAERTVAGEQVRIAEVDVAARCCRMLTEREGRGGHVASLGPGADGARPSG